MTNIKFRPIKLDEDNEVYQMFQEIPAGENGFYNTACGLSKKAAISDTASALPAAVKILVI